MFLVKPVFSRYFRKFLVATPSADMTKGYIGTLLSFQIFFISRAKFSYFIIFSALVLERLRVKQTAEYIKSAVLFSLPMNTVSCLSKSTVGSVLIDPSEHKIMLADSSTTSGLYLWYGRLL